VPAGLPPVFQTTDHHILQTVLTRLLEPEVDSPPITVQSEQWTADELVDYLSQVQNRFIRETGLVTAREGFDGSASGQNRSIALVPEQETIALPQNLVDVLRLAFVSYNGSGNVKSIREVPREDFTSLDALDPTWEGNYQAIPSGYTQSVTETLKMFLAHPPNNIGGADLTYVGFGQTLTGLCVPLSVPDDFAWVLVYGVLAAAFGKQGESYDPERAAYCQRRFDEGVILARSLLSFPASVDPEFA
jgi:hypothetical protein